MINPAEFKLLMRPIVAEHYPNELFAFDVSSDELMQKLKLDGHIETAARKESRINFMEQAMAVLGFLGVLISTYKAVVEIRSLQLKNKIDRQTIEKSWLELLREHGLTNEMAQKIVSKHLEEFNEYLNR
ncbi:MAG: hypothetical protein DI535_00725 [Citrobacter freundii]|nr:MAG: hypothetical protein DI535_00725 [Citrobacter freundii]